MFTVIIFVKTLKMTEENISNYFVFFLRCPDTQYCENSYEHRTMCSQKPSFNFNVDLPVNNIRILKLPRKPFSSTNHFVYF